MPNGNGKGNSNGHDKSFHSSAYISPEDKAELASFWRERAMEALDMAQWCEIAYEAEKHMGMPQARLEALVSQWKLQLQIAKEAEAIAEELMKGEESK